MKKRGWTIATLCVALLVALFVWRTSLLPPAVDQTVVHLCKHENETNCFKAAGSVLLEPFKEDAEAYIALFTVVLGVSTVVLAISTIFLWRATSKTLDHARETTQRQLRAYVAIRKICIKGLKLVPGSKPMIHWEIWNNGQTPAYGVTTDIEAIYERSMWDATAHEPQSTGPESVLNPQTFFSNNQLVGDGALTPQMIKELSDGTHTIHVHGIVRYRDTFGQNFLTKIWTTLDLTDGPDGPDDEYFPRQAERGNAST